MAAFPFDVGADLIAVVDGTTTATVRQVDPDTGATLNAANNVGCFLPEYAADVAAVGDGEVGTTGTTIWLKAADVRFVPKPHDEVVVDGVTWSAGVVDVEAFGTLYVLKGCVKKR